jgi:hypothetical protein
MRRLIVSLLLIVVACGQVKAQPATSPLAAATTTPRATAPAVPGPSPSASPTPNAGASPSPAPVALPTPSTSASLLFAVLEAKGAASKVVQWDTVAIAGLDGYARAKTTFTPMRVPTVGCTGGAVTPPSAHVAAGKVYFADGAGVVRSLSVNGQTTTVATFPLTSGQQMLSFVISPDATRLLGAVFTMPPNPQFGCNGSHGVGDFTLDVYSAPAGGTNILLRHEVLQHNDPAVTIWPVNVMALVGWDQVGPVATYPSEVVSQGHPPLNYTGTPVRVDLNDGTVLKQVSDPASCYVQDIVLSGNFACSLGAANELSVRRPDRSEIWRGKSQLQNFFVAFLSPDEGRTVLAGSGTEVLGLDGSRVLVAIWPVGWLDSATLIGTNDAGNLSFVALNGPGTNVDMGFKGQFVGTVRT